MQCFNCAKFFKGDPNEGELCESCSKEVDNSLEDDCGFNFYDMHSEVDAALEDMLYE